MGEIISIVLAHSQQKKECVHLSGLAFSWLRLSMIQNLNKTWGLEHGATGSKNFINASVIDTLTAVKHAANPAQVLQIILWFQR